MISCCGVCFFFQAEDGIRDYKVTGVQTCALPICIGVCSVTWRYSPFLRVRQCGDWKSTRLNSSHLVISYAVFCLKKKAYTSLWSGGGHASGACRCAQSPDVAA